MVDGTTWASERALLREYEGTLEEANARARDAARRLRDLPGIEDVIPGARSVLVVLEEPGEPAVDVRRALAEAVAARETEGTLHTIPVAYDGDDLAVVAAEARMTTAEVVRIHSDAEYRVAFLGFSPGFAYLLGLPEALQGPRLATPRPRVPAGSVAIAGPFSAVYPRATPGGWRLLGRTDTTMFDAASEPSALLQPGDRVRFVRA